MKYDILLSKQIGVSRKNIVWCCVKIADQSEAFETYCNSEEEHKYDKTYLGQGVIHKP